MKKAAFRGTAALALVVAGFTACGVVAQDAPGAAITSAVSDQRRPAADSARDANRKPAETVAFAGVKEGDVVAEIAPGGGYYTRILAASVGPKGKVYALMPGFVANRPGGLDAINALAKQYGNVEVVTVADYADLNLPQKANVVWTTENYHDLANGNIKAIDDWALRALEPGGVFFVEDHAAAPGAGTSATSTLHRIDPEAVKQQVTTAGFKLDGQSDLLRNPDDPHTAASHDMNGKSDRFALRFRKPY